MFAGEIFKRDVCTAPQTAASKRLFDVSELIRSSRGAISIIYMPRDAEIWSNTNGIFKFLKTHLAIDLSCEFAFKFRVDFAHKTGAFWLIKNIGLIKWEEFICKLTGKWEKYLCYFLYQLRFFLIFESLLIHCMTFDGKSIFPSKNHFLVKVDKRV